MPRAGLCRVRLGWYWWGRRRGLRGRHNPGSAGLVIGGLLGVGNEPKPEQEIMKVNERDEVSAVAGDLVGERGLADESVLPVSCSGVPDAAAGPAGVALAGLSAGQVTRVNAQVLKGSHHLVGQGDGYRAAVAAAVPVCSRAGTFR